jgi:hypothetical protein
MLAHNGQMHSITGGQLPMSQNDLFRPLRRNPVDGQHLINNPEQSIKGRLNSDGGIAMISCSTSASVTKRWRSLTRFSSKRWASVLWRCDAGGRIAHLAGSQTDSGFLWQNVFRTPCGNRSRSNSWRLLGALPFPDSANHHLAQARTAIRAGMDFFDQFQVHLITKLDPQDHDWIDDHR